MKTNNAYWRHSGRISGRFICVEKFYKYNLDKKWDKTETAYITACLDANTKKKKKKRVTLNTKIHTTTTSALRFTSFSKSFSSATIETFVQNCKMLNNIDLLHNQFVCIVVICEMILISNAQFPYDDIVHFIYSKISLNFLFNLENFIMNLNILIRFVFLVSWVMGYNILFTFQLTSAFISFSYLFFHSLIAHTC